MRLERQSAGRARTEDSLSHQRAEIISRLWQAIAFLEELRADLLTEVRAGADTTAAAGRLQNATREIVTAAELLTPMRRLTAAK